MITAAKLHQLNRENIRATNRLGYIAGGALRDIDFGRAPKDIDIFVPVYNSENKGGVVDSYIRDFNTIEGMRYEGNAVDNEYAQNPAFNKVHEVHNFYWGDDADPVQVIFLNHPADEDVDKALLRKWIVDCFDLNLCQILLSFNGRESVIRRTADYKEGKLQNQLWNLNSDETNRDAIDKTKQRAQAISQKLRVGNATIFGADLGAPVPVNRPNYFRAPVFRPGTLENITFNLGRINLNNGGVQNNQENNRFNQVNIIPR